MPFSVRIGLTVILFALSAALIATAMRARAGSLRRSGLVGVRTPSAMVDDRAFARANLAAVPFEIAGAVIAALLALLIAITGLRELNGIAGSAAVIVAGIVLGGLLLLGGLRGERAARNGGPTSSVSPASARGRRAAGSGSSRRSPGRSSSSKNRPAARSKVSGRGGEPRRPSR